MAHKVEVEFRDGSKEIVECEAPNTRDAAKIAERYATAEKYAGRSWLRGLVVKKTRVDESITIKRR